MGLHISISELDYEPKGEDQVLLGTRPLVTPERKQGGCGFFERPMKLQ
jgi:hypothetical protein